MYKVLLSFLVLSMLGLPVCHAQTVKSSGFVFGAGKGLPMYHLPVNSELGIPFDAESSYLKHSFSAGIGYQLRLQRDGSRFFTDVALRAQYNRYQYNVGYLSGTDGVSYVGGNGNCNLLSSSASVGVGYYLYKGINLSVGLEPTYSVWDQSFFDLPAFIRLGYDFKSVEVALSYRIGTLRNFHLAPFQKVHLSQWELSVYVPLWRRDD